MVLFTLNFSLCDEMSFVFFIANVNIQNANLNINIKFKINNVDAKVATCCVDV